MKPKDPIDMRAENDAIGWLVTLNSPRLTADQEQAFMDWLAASPRHQAAYIHAEQLWERGALLEQLSSANRPVTFLGWWRDLLGQNPLVWKSTAVACTCVLVLLVGGLLWMNKSSEFVYQTAIGEVKEFQLEDGSRISLNTNSQLQVELSRSARSARLIQGEVYFDVKHDGRPFEVLTPYGIARVLGTRFSIRQLANDALVSVAEGRVGLGKTNARAESFTPLVVLGANQQLSLQGAQSATSPETINSAMTLAWRKKQLVFKGARLGQVVTELSRYFPEKIVLQDPALADREITAVIQLTDFESTLQTLSQSLGLGLVLDSSHQQATLIPR